MSDDEKAKATEAAAIETAEKAQANRSFAAPHGSATDVYDPVVSLRKEVDRFRATNQFSPMLVTNFYAQAAVVLAELERTRELLAANMKDTYKGKTAKEWFKLHEVMRRDFKRVLGERDKIAKVRSE